MTSIYSSGPRPHIGTLAPDPISGISPLDAVRSVSERAIFEVSDVVRISVRDVSVVSVNLSGYLSETCPYRNTVSSGRTTPSFRGCPSPDGIAPSELPK